MFGLPHASNGFSNYTYLKHMYITLKGIGKNLFVSVLRILVICKCLSFMVDFTKRNLNFSKLAHNFACGKVNFSLILGLILNIFFDEFLDSAILTQNSQFPYFSFSLKLTFLCRSEWGTVYFMLVLSRKHQYNDLFSLKGRPILLLLRLDLWFTI